MISKLYAEGHINDEDRDKLKGILTLSFLTLILDMIFSEDAILLSFFNRYEDEEELKEAIIKYCQGGAIEAKRPSDIEPVKGDLTDLDQVRFHG